MENFSYDVAQICKNGHVVNRATRGLPAHNQAHCDRCGSRTITACPECDAGIRGHYHIPGALITWGYEAPAYCHACGGAFPWTEKTLDAAKDLADELDSLSDHEKESLKKELHNLLEQTPRTRLAESRFKKLMKKSGEEGRVVMRGILINVLNEAACGRIFGE